MAKKRGGSPASRNVMRQVRLCKETHVDKLPVLDDNVPHSVLPYISAGGSKRRRRRRRRRRTRKGGSPLSEAVQGLVGLKQMFAERPPLDNFPPRSNFGSIKDTAKIPEIFSTPINLTPDVAGDIQSKAAKNSEIVGGRRKRSRRSKKGKKSRKGRKSKKSKKGGSAFKSTLYSWSINPSGQKTLQTFSPGAVQYSPTSSKMVNNTVMFKPFKKGGRRRRRRSKSV